jgi:hypothetical protein
LGRIPGCGKKICHKELERETILEKIHPDGN